MPDFLEIMYTVDFLEIMYIYSGEIPEAVGNCCQRPPVTIAVIDKYETIAGFQLGVNKIISFLQLWKKNFSDSPKNHKNISESCGAGL